MQCSVIEIKYNIIYMKRKIINIFEIIWLFIGPVLIILGIIHVVNDFNEFGVLFNSATTVVELIKFLLVCCYEVIKDFIITFLVITIWIVIAKFVDEF